MSRWAHLYFPLTFLPSVGLVDLSVAIIPDQMTFEDVTVYFWEDWGLLDETQRHLYHELMLENFALVASLMSAPASY